MVPLGHLFVGRPRATVCAKCAPQIAFDFEPIDREANHLLVGKVALRSCGLHRRDHAMQILRPPRLTRLHARDLELLRRGHDDGPRRRHRKFRLRDICLAAAAWHDNTRPFLTHLGGFAFHARTYFSSRWRRLGCRTGETRSGRRSRSPAKVPSPGTGGICAPIWWFSYFFFGRPSRQLRGRRPTMRRSVDFFGDLR